MERLLLTLLAIASFSCYAEDFEVYTEQGRLHVQASRQLFQSEDPKDHQEGFSQLMAEYEAGSAYSAGKLGWAYQRGLGVNQDLEKAKKLYEYAASHGMTYWHYLLAHAHEMGYLGYPKDEEMFEYWLNHEPKIHIAVYECWVHYYYESGIFPKDNSQLERHKANCERADQ